MAIEFPDDAPPRATAKAGEKDSAPKPETTQCEYDGGCTKEIKIPATGRPPKYCDDHKGNRQKKVTGTQERPVTKSDLSNKNWPEALFVEATLNRMFAMASIGITMVNAEDGKVIAKGGPNISRELCKLAIDDPQLRKALNTLVAPGKYGPLSMAVMGVVLPIMANHGLIPQLTIDLSALSKAV